ncbi:MAG: hypothetical protein F7C37_06095 [Desulfurococcales archaeon]|nr:hypothetical protein [Desulfurococcales archaeon]
MQLYVRELERKVEECRRELSRLRGELAAIRDWLDEVERLHAVLTVRLYELELSVKEGGEDE